MKGRRHSPEQIVRKLREADRLLAEGADVDAVCRHLEISIQTYQRWRSQYKAMRPEDVVRLKQLEENARLKRLLAEKELDNDMLREVVGETGKPGAAAQGGLAPAEPLPGLRTAGLSVYSPVSVCAAISAPMRQRRAAVAGASAAVG
jgi:putative transposase